MCVKKARRAFNKHAGPTLTCVSATPPTSSRPWLSPWSTTRWTVPSRPSCLHTCPSSTTWGCTGSPPGSPPFTRYNTSPALVRWTTSLSGLWAEFPHGAIYVMNIMRTKRGINKAESQVSPPWCSILPTGKQHCSCFTLRSEAGLASRFPLVTLAAGHPDGLPLNHG